MKSQSFVVLLETKGRLKNDDGETTHCQQSIDGEDDDWFDELKDM